MNKEAKDMKIVDSQVHIWYPHTPERPWPPHNPKNIPHRDRPFVIQDLLAEMRAAGVDRAIIVPPTWEGGRNDKAIEGARLYPDRLAVMGRITLNDPETWDKVATWKKQPGMLGVRFTFGWGKEAPWLLDGTADRFWPIAEKAGLGVMLNVPALLEPAKAIAEKHPGLKIIIDHMGIPGRTRDDALTEHFSELCKIARFPNVAVKMTALPNYSSQPYPYSNLHLLLKPVYDAFGPKRLFWGSDLTRLPCSYRLCVTMMTEEMKWLSATDLEWIMGRGVCEWLGWPLQE